MRRGWSKLAIGDVFKTVTGTTPPKGNFQYYGSFAPFVKPPELNNNSVAAADDGLSELGISDCARRAAKLHSCLLHRDFRKDRSRGAGPCIQSTDQRDIAE